MSHLKKDVERSLDTSHGLHFTSTALAVGGSSATSPGVSSRDAFITQKSASFDVVDASTQADFGCDVITYDSDDEMVKSRRGIPFGGLRNKKGHPIYSREDIREQYCINRKELEVLDALHSGTSNRLFGCISAGHLPDQSPCNKNSFLLLSCVHRRKNSAEIDDDSDARKRNTHLKNSALKNVTIDEDDSSDGGFKSRRSRSWTTAAQHTYESGHKEPIIDHQMPYHQIIRPKIIASNSLENQSYGQSYGQSYAQSYAQRPKILNFNNKKDIALYGATCHSVDELSDHRLSNEMEWTNQRMPNTPDILDDRHHHDHIKKHVTFAMTNQQPLTRSATVGGINCHTITPSSDPSSSGAFHERLVNGQSLGSFESKNQSLMSYDSSDSMLMSMHQMIKSPTESMTGMSSYTNQSYGYLPMYRIMRRAVMKTQATQTEAGRSNSSKSSTRSSSSKSSRRSIPAYLQLSPRAGDGALRTVHNTDDIDDVIKITNPIRFSSEEEDEVMVCVREKTFVKRAHYRGGKVSDDGKPKSRRRTRNRNKLSPDVEKDMITLLSKSSHEIPFKKFDSESYDRIVKGDYIITPLTSSESSQAIISGSGGTGTDADADMLSSTTTDVDSSIQSFKKDDSSTIISELNEQLIIASDSDHLPESHDTVHSEQSDITKRPLIIDPTRCKLMKDMNVLTSPESDQEIVIGIRKGMELSPSNSSSGPGTCGECEEKMSGSGSSSVYLTANEHSLVIGSADGVKEKVGSGSGATSFETASSGSVFSSPPSPPRNELKGPESSSSRSDEAKDLPSPDETPQTKPLSSFTTQPYHNVSPLITPLKCVRITSSGDNAIKSESSDDTSTAKRDQRTYSPGSESLGSTHYSTEHNIEDFEDSDVIDFDIDITASGHDICSSDTSTAVEQTTVVENTKPLKPKIPPKPTFLLSEQKIQLPKKISIVSNVTISKDEVKEETSLFKEIHESSTSFISEKHVQSDHDEDIESIDEHCEESADDEEIVDNLSGGDYVCRRTMSGELSTVSEVSEEISVNGKSQKSDHFMFPDSSHLQKIMEINYRSNGNDSNGNGRLNSPSYAESSTSGSFMIEGNITEPTSLAESLNAEGKVMEKSGSFPCLSGNEMSFSSSLRKDTVISTENKSVASNVIVTEDVSFKDENTHEIRDDKNQETGQSQATDRDIEQSEFSLMHQEMEDDSVSKEDTAMSISQSFHDEQHNEIEGLHEESGVFESEQLKSVKFNNNGNESEHRRRKDRKFHSEKISGHTSTTFTADEWNAILQRRARSLSRSPENILDVPFPSQSNKTDLKHDHHHHFTCTQCGVHQQTVSTSLISSIRKSLPFPYRKSATFDDIYLNGSDDEEDIGVHSESYRSALWVYIGFKDELQVWGHKNAKSIFAVDANDGGDGGDGGNECLPSDDASVLLRIDSNESTLSEKEFRRNYESVTHRMIHRKASIEMYKRVMSKTFDVEKTITITRINGEFGFRIHGSRPVVVSAIEKGTPAETCGLDVGDIVVSVNGVNVLESSHSEVVKLAHCGNDTLTLECISTKNTLNHNDHTDCFSSDDRRCDVIMNGHLKRLTKSIDTNNGTKYLFRQKNRWFMLKSDYCLYWYKSTKQMDPLGVISLQGYTATIEPESVADMPFTFKLVRCGSKTQYFAATDLETVQQWVNALNDASNKINQGDPFVDITLQNVHCSAMSFTCCDCCGYLGKFSERRKVWRHRYFVLKDACLYFYHNAAANSALGAYYLHGYRVQSCLIMGKKHTFETIPPEPKFKYLCLLAESDADKKRWLSALEYSIDRWIRCS